MAIHSYTEAERSTAAEELQWVDGLPVPALAVTDRGFIVRASAVTGHLITANPVQLRGRTWLSLAPPEDRPNLIRAHWQALTTAAAVTVVHRLTRPTDAPAWVRSRLAPLGGHAAHRLIISLPLGAAASVSAEQTRHGSPQGRWVNPGRPPDARLILERDGTICEADPAAQSLLGAGDTLVGRRLEDLATRDEHDQPIAPDDLPHRLALLTGQIIDQTITVHRAGGNPTYLHVRAIPLDGPDEATHRVALLLVRALGPAPRCASPRVGSPVHAAPGPVNVGSCMTDREVGVLALLADGLSVPAIAGRLVLGDDIVQSHVDSVLTKLGARTHLDAVLTGLRNGIIHLDHGTAPKATAW